MIEEVLAVLRRFIEALRKVSLEEEKLKHIVKRVRLHRILDSQRPMILRFEVAQSRRPKDVRLCEDFWFYWGVNNQVLTHFQDTKKEVAER